jgi:hypothetical protein
MANPDYRVNEYGVDVRFLRVGQWVIVRYDGEPDMKALLTYVEDRQDSYKGERTLKGLHLMEGGWQVHSFTNTIVVETYDYHCLKAPK